MQPSKTLLKRVEFLQEGKIRTVWFHQLVGPRMSQSPPGSHSQGSEGMLKSQLCFMRSRFICYVFPHLDLFFCTRTEDVILLLECVQFLSSKFKRGQESAHFYV